MGELPRDAVAAGIQNTGRYVWELDQPMPRAFRIAIDVQDRAGNRQMAESREVVLDTSSPKVQITRIQAASERL